MELSPEIQQGVNYLFVAVVAWFSRVKADIIILKQSSKKAHERIDFLAQKLGIDLTPIKGDAGNKEN